MSWATIAAAITDLRTLLSDGSQDKRAWRKRVVGFADGSNTFFKTIEVRYVSQSLQIYLNGTLLVNGSDFLETDPVSGDFTFKLGGVSGKGPPQNAEIQASYYYQYFLDSELTTALNNGARFLGFTGPTLVTDGLVPSCLHYAGADSYEKLANRWSETLSEQYLAEDSPGVMDGKPQPKALMFRGLSTDMMKKAIQLRDDFYKRQGQRFAPVSTILVGAVQETQPRR